MARQTKDIFDALVADHDRHRLLLKKLGKEDAAPEDRMALPRRRNRRFIR